MKHSYCCCPETENNRTWIDIVVDVRVMDRIPAAAGRQTEAAGDPESFLMARGEAMEGFFDGLREPLDFPVYDNKWVAD